MRTTHGGRYRHARLCASAKATSSNIVRLLFRIILSRNIFAAIKKSRLIFVNVNHYCAQDHVRKAHGACLGLCTHGTARHSCVWRGLAGFWRDKAGAGHVPSFISGCAVAIMLEGVFSRIIRVA
jgi:hypothetical protein